MLRSGQRREHFEGHLRVRRAVDGYRCIGSFRTLPETPTIRTVVVGGMSEKRKLGDIGWFFVNSLARILQEGEVDKTIYPTRMQPPAEQIY